MIAQQIREGWRGFGGGSKLLLVLFLLLHIPAAYLAVNNMSCGFSPDRAAYEHLAQIDRVYEGKPIYAPMTVEFSPITYTPLYWVVCGWLWKLTGPGFFVPQLVSLLATFVFLYFAARFLWGGTSRDLFLTALGIVDLLLLNLSTGIWLCGLNNDALHFALTIAGFYCLGKAGPRPAAWAALWLSLGALTKQTGLAYVAAGALYVLLKEPRRFVFYAVPALVVCGGGLAFLQIQSGGLFYDIVVKENRGPFWEMSRLVTEVWGSQFLGLVGILSLFSLWPLLASKTWREAWQRMLTPEYTMAAAGMAVACIAQPKFGSGNNHAVIAITGLVICGWQGLRFTMGQIRDAGISASLRGGAAVLQTVALLIPAWQQASVRLIDEADRYKYSQIEEVFKRGYTVIYHFPYITGSFGYSEAGHQGNELCRWINGQWSFANKPDFLSAPYREQKFDYVILCASVVDQADPTIQAILANYSVASTLPPHPTRPNTQMMRYPVYVLRANRLNAP